MGAMCAHSKLKLIVVFSAVGLSVCWAQDDYRHGNGSYLHGENLAAARENHGTLTYDDRLSILAAALDSRVARSEPDCSHLVHAIYKEAGFSYAYAPSSEIYSHADSFQRVKQPQPGDLVVWRGHVGIVIKPSQHVFFSYLTSGPGVDDYQSPYWKSRGKPRFYRYVKR